MIGAGVGGGAIGAASTGYGAIGSGEAGGSCGVGNGVGACGTSGGNGAAGVANWFACEKSCCMATGGWVVSVGITKPVPPIAAELSGIGVDTLVAGGVTGSAGC